MTTRHTALKLTTVLFAFALVAAACGDGDTATTTAAPQDTTTTTAGPTTAGPTTTTPEQPSTTVEAPPTTVDDHVSLVGICPDPLVIQTDWFPQPEHAWTYNLIGVDGVVDADNGTYSGPLGDTGITLEMRAGGPYVGFSPPSSQFYSDDSIFAAYVDSGTSIRDSGTLPVVAVYAPWDRSPQILMWDPDAFTFDDFEAIGESGAPVLYFAGSTYMDYLLQKGLLSEDQIDGSYDGGPSRFVTEQVVQQGFVTNEVYRYENDIEGWKKPVAWKLIFESGFAIYDGALSVKPNQIVDDAECLEALVPLVQQSHVDYMTNPEPMNVRLDEIVKELNSFWTSSVGLHNAATQMMIEADLVTDGDNGTNGDMDDARIQALIDEWLPLLEAAGIDSFKPGLQASDIQTNQFLDPTIGFGF